MIAIRVDSVDQQLRQWDKGQRLVLEGVAADTRCDFAYENAEHSKPEYAYEEDGVTYCDIPDTILMEDGKLTVYAYLEEGSKGESYYAGVLYVEPMPKPSDYVEPEDIPLWSDLQNQINEMRDRPASESAPADLAINDPMAPGYVKNRTHWKETVQVPLDIRWDGNTEGRPYATANGWTFFKVSDLILTDDELAACCGVYGGYPFEQSNRDGWSKCGSSTVTDCGVGVARSTEDNFDLTGGEPVYVPETGIYFVYRGSQEYVSRLYSDTVTMPGTFYRKLPREYLPDDLGGGIAVTGATVGQTVRIAAVDDRGVPTAWEPVDMAGEGGSERAWKLLVDFELAEEVDATTGMVFDTDDAGNPIDATEILIDWYCPANQPSYAKLLVNGVREEKNGYFWSGELTGTKECAALMRFTAMGDMCLLTGREDIYFIRDAVWFVGEGMFNSINSLQLTMWGNTYPAGLKFKIWGR